MNKSSSRSLSREREKEIYSLYIQLNIQKKTLKKEKNIIQLPLTVLKQ